MDMTIAEQRRQDFINSLEPRTVEILEAIATDAAVKVSESELRSDIKAARAEARTARESEMPEFVNSRRRRKVAVGA